MDIVEAPYLTEESCKWFFIIFSVINSPGPVVTPFNHSSWFQTVTSNLINIVTTSSLNGWPVTKR